jgi:hypothetical protein
MKFNIHYKDLNNDVLTNTKQKVRYYLITTKCYKANIIKYDKICVYYNRSTILNKNL